MPLLEAVGALHVVARVAALAFRTCAVARAALLLVVDFLLFLWVRAPLRARRAALALPVLGLLEGLELILVRQGTAQLEPRLPPDRLHAECRIPACQKRRALSVEAGKWGATHLAVPVEPVLPNAVVLLVDVEALPLPGRIVGVRRQQRARDVRESQVKLHLEAVGALRHDVHMIQEGRCQVVAVLAADEVQREREGRDGEESAGESPDPEFRRDGGVGVHGPDVLGVGLLHGWNAGRVSNTGDVGARSAPITSIVFTYVHLKETLLMLLSVAR